jgi:hypothetical protein
LLKRIFNQKQLSQLREKITVWTNCHTVWARDGLW